MGIVNLGVLVKFVRQSRPTDFNNRITITGCQTTLVLRAASPDPGRGRIASINFDYYNSGFQQRSDSR